MLLGTLGASLLGNILAGRGINSFRKGQGIIELVKILYELVIETRT